MPVLFETTGTWFQKSAVSGTISAGSDWTIGPTVQSDRAYAVSPKKNGSVWTGLSIPPPPVIFGVYANYADILQFFSIA